MDWTSLPPVIYCGVRYDEVLTVTDRATKMMHLIPTRKTATALETAELFFAYIVRYHGLPRSIVSDRDRLFTSDFWRAICDRL